MAHPTVLVQMVGFLWVTGFSYGVIIALMFTFIPILPGIWVLHSDRLTSSLSKKDHISPGIIGLFGLQFWAGLITRPVITFIAAVVPERFNANPPINKLH